MTYPLPATFPFPPPPAPPHPPPFPAPLPVIHLNNNLNFETFRTRQRITKQGYGTHITTPNSLNKSNLTLTLISTYTEYPKILPRISHANTGVRLSGCSWRTQFQLHLYTKYCINIKSSLRTKNDSKTRRPAKIGQINLENTSSNLQSGRFDNMAELFLQRVMGSFLRLARCPRELWHDKSEEITKLMQSSEFFQAQTYSSLLERECRIIPGLLWKDFFQGQYHEIPIIIPTARPGQKCSCTFNLRSGHSWAEIACWPEWPNW